MSAHYARGKLAQTLRIADAEDKKRRILCNVRVNFMRSIQTEPTNGPPSSSVREILSPPRRLAPTDRFTSVLGITMSILSIQIRAKSIQAGLTLPASMLRVRQPLPPTARF